MVLLACLALLVALGLIERAAARRARAAVPIRIHVNGTRGKSTVTRLVAAALREAGIPTLAKVTGTAPRLIRPDGVEEPVRRRAPASIREQAWLLREARRAGARAVVAECMAVRPDLQGVSEREMVHATIGVITNARLDHTEVMGRSVEAIARSLASTVPRGGVLVTGDARFAEAFSARCAPLDTRLVIARERAEGLDCAECPEVRGPNVRMSDFRTLGPSDPRTSWLREDLAIALAVTRELGIADEVALRGMTKAASDPGAVTRGIATIAGHEVAWIDATAANDPESLDLLVTGLEPCPAVVVFNHRADRPDRLRAFAASSTTLRESAAVRLTGDRPSLTLIAAVRRLCPGIAIRFVPPRRLATAIAAVSADIGARSVIFCGNTRGFVRPFGKDAGESAEDSRQSRQPTVDQRPTTMTNDQRP